MEKKTSRHVKKRGGHERWKIISKRNDRNGDEPGVVSHCKCIVMVNFHKVPCKCRCLVNLSTPF